MRSERGSSLIEAILALTMAVIIITAIVAAVSSALNSTSANQNQNLATGLAQEGIDNIRNFKVQYYPSFRNNFISGSYCLEEASPSGSVSTDGSCTKIASGGRGDAIFTRKVYINHQGRDARLTPSTTPCAISPAVFIAVSVIWTDNKCNNATDCHKIELTSCFVDTNALPNP